MVARKKKSTATNMMRNCDDRARKHVVARGACQRCGNACVPLECAHIIRRRKSWVRTDERNLWALCHWCHQVVDLHESQKWALIESTIGFDLFLELERKAEQGSKENGGQRFDWAAELERWKQMS